MNLKEQTVLRVVKESIHLTRKAQKLYRHFIIMHTQCSIVTQITPVNPASINQMLCLISARAILKTSTQFRIKIVQNKLTTTVVDLKTQ